MRGFFIVLITADISTVVYVYNVSNMLNLISFEAQKEDKQV